MPGQIFSGPLSDEARVASYPRCTCSANGAGRATGETPLLVERFVLYFETLSFPQDQLPVAGFSEAIIAARHLRHSFRWEVQLHKVKTI